MFDIAKLPSDFVTRMELQLGAQYPLFRESLTRESPTSVRLNLLKCESFSDSKQVAWCGSGRYLEARPVFTLDPHFHSGSYYVQEASSMFLEQALKQHVDLTQPHRVLDLCAAPGGKSTHLISLLSQDSLLVSNEVIRSRASVLQENLQKWGFANSIVTSSDPQAFTTLNSFFDVIVADTPCSGEGLFRKDPESMREWSADNVQLCAGRQRRILSDVWPALREGGLLIYSTCTYNREENEENLNWLSTQKEIEFLPIMTDPSWGVTEVMEGKVRGYRFYPHTCSGEGFFISVIRKLDHEVQLKAKAKRSSELLAKQYLLKVSPWIREPGRFTFLHRNSDVFVFPASQVHNLHLLARHLYFVHVGVTLGTIKHDKVIPDHALALSVDCDQDVFPCYELTKEEAVHYLRKDVLTLSTGQRGFTLVRYQQQPLGWVNVLDTRVNNLYPSSWRIRMSG